MNVDHILAEFNRHRVAYLLIGGVNFLLRHQPVLTYDIDLWIEDTAENRQRCAEALEALGTEWGGTESQWQPVTEQPAGWMEGQAVFCLTSPHGAIDVFRSIEGLADWAACRARARPEQTAAGVAYLGLSDEDMLRSQQVLPATSQKQDRMRTLQQSLERSRE